MSLQSEVRVVVDRDPGHGELFAFLLAAQNADLRAITTVAGNAPVAQTTANAFLGTSFAVAAEGRLTRRMTVADRRGEKGEMPANADVFSAVDADAVLDLFHPAEAKAAGDNRARA